MELLIFWLIVAVIVGVIASNRGRSGFGGFLLSVLISPLLGLILVLVLADKKKELQERQTTNPGPRAACWQCKEMVVVGAGKCRYCGAELHWPSANQPPVAQ